MLWLREERPGLRTEYHLRIRLFGPAHGPVGGPAHRPVGGPAHRPVGGPAHRLVGPALGPGGVGSGGDGGGGILGGGAQQSKRACVADERGG